MDNKGDAFSNLSDYYKSIEVFDGLIQIDPHNATPWCRKSYIFKKMGKYIPAISCYLKAITVDPFSFVKPFVEPFLELAGLEIESKCSFVEPFVEPFLELARLEIESKT